MTSVGKEKDPEFGCFLSALCRYPCCVSVSTAQCRAHTHLYIALQRTCVTCPTTAIFTHSGPACAVQKLRVTSMYRSCLHWQTRRSGILSYFISQVPSSYLCFIFVCFEHSLCATPITNTMSWRQKKDVLLTDWRTTLTYFLKNETLCCDMLHTRALISSRFSWLAGVLLCLWLNSLMSGWVCQRKPFWIPVGESFQKDCLEEWIHMGWRSTFSTNTNGQPCALTWELLGPQGTASPWERTEAPCASPKTWVQFYWPEAAQSFSWTPGAAVSWWRDPVGLWGCGLLRPRPLHYAGKDRPRCYLRTTYGRCSKGPRRISRGIRKKTRYIFSGVSLRQQRA